MCSYLSNYSNLSLCLANKESWRYDDILKSRAINRHLLSHEGTSCFIQKQFLCVLFVFLTVKITSLALQVDAHSWKLQASAGRLATFLQ